MTRFSVELKSSARRELEELPAKVIGRVISRLEQLEATPRPPGCKKLRGGRDEWRLRIGDWRVIYTIDDSRSLVEVTRIRHRSDVYDF